MGNIEMRPMGPGQAGLSVRSFRERDLVRCNTGRLAQKATQRAASQGEQRPVFYALRGTVDRQGDSAASWGEGF